MWMKKYCISVILIISGLSLMFVSCASCRVAPGDNDDNLSPLLKHPAVAILRLYKEVDKKEVIIIPYSINLMAIDLLKKGSSPSKVKTYILWYLDHLNYPDKYGLTGSMYDYRIDENGDETSLESCDSIDSYAATFIILIDRYFKLTGDLKLIESNRQKIEDVAYVIPFLRGEDGLTEALPDQDERYLMDNCEAYGGLSAFVELCRALEWDILAYYQEQKLLLRDAIWDQLYDTERGNFYWAIEDSQIHPSKWTVFYPDSYAQLFPILYGLIDNRDRALFMWNLFHENHAGIISELPVEQKLNYDWTKEAILNGKRIDYDRTVKNDY